MQPTRAAHASIRFLVPPHGGTLERAEGLSQTEGVVDARMYVAPGGLVAVRGDFRDRIGHVLAVGPDGETARLRAERARDRVRLQVRPTGPS